MLIQYGISTPAVFGLYASWGTGKSFIMTKCISALKTFWLRQKIVSYYRVIDPEDKSDPKDKRLVEDKLEAMLKEDEEEIDNLYKWCLLGCPSEAVRFKEDSDKREYVPLKKLDCKFINRKLASFHDTSFFMISEVFNFIFGMLIVLHDKFFPLYHRNDQLKHGWIVHRILKQAVVNESKNPWISPERNQKEEKLSTSFNHIFNFKGYKYKQVDESYEIADSTKSDKDDEFKPEKDDCYDYEFVWWNA
jgi:hypothetical protein